MAKASINNNENSNAFYRNYFHRMIIGLVACIVMMIVMVILLLFQIYNRPIPPFVAFSNDSQQMPLTAYDNPNLLSSTLIKWASRAAVAAYTYDFYNYQKQLDMVRPYFTEAGWASYRASMQGVIDTILANKLFVNGVISAPPVISNQGSLGDYQKTWRIQVPFLVTYQSAENTTNSAYMVTLIVVKVPTTENPAAIAIDQFVMR